MGPSEEPLSTSPGSRPIPDPTLLTGQLDHCTRYGREDTVRYFQVYGITISPDDVKVSCRNYQGSD
jgi:hypothetical protein